MGQEQEKGAAGASREAPDLPPGDLRMESTCGGGSKQRLRSGGRCGAPDVEVSHSGRTQGPGRFIVMR